MFMRSDVCCGWWLMSPLMEKPIRDGDQMGTWCGGGILAILVRDIIMQTLWPVELLSFSPAITLERRLILSAQACRFK